MKFFREIIKEIAGLLVRFSGISFMIRKIICNKRVTIALYHNPRPETFKKHITYLSHHYRIISLGELVNAIENKDWSNIPPQSLVITFDDGHKGNYELLDIFKAYSVRPTIYLCSHIIDTNRHFWWKTGYPDYNKLKEIPHNMLLEKLRKKVDYEPEKEYQNRQALNLREIIEMLPYVSFGSHTKFHPVLTNCSDEKCRDEIANSKNHLEKLLGNTVDHFCFPNGDYSSREIEHVKKSGYRSARTSDVGWNDINSDPYKLNVMEVEDDNSLNVLCLKTIGLFTCLRFFSKSIFRK